MAASFVDLKLLKVRDVIKSQQLKLAYEFFINTLPSDLQNLFKLSSDSHTTQMKLNSAYKKHFYIPQIKTVTYGNIYQ